MAKETVTKRIKTSRPVTESELLAALRESMGPIFQHFEEELVKGDGKVLQIEVTAKAGNIKLSYGIGVMLEAANAGREASAGRGPNQTDG
jgi:hypothetical protein